MFEKVNNYKLQQMLLSNSDGPFLLTGPQKTWLSEILDKPEAAAFFTPQQFDTLKHLLEKYKVPSSTPHLFKKASVTTSPLASPWFFPLREIIRNRQGMLISFRTNKNIQRDSLEGIPCQMEYSMIRHEWYVRWWDQTNKFPCSTPLRSILDVKTTNPIEYEQSRRNFLQSIQLSSKQVSLEISFTPTDPISFEDLVRRVFYGFSCFDKEINYNEVDKIYRLLVYYEADEEAYISF